MENAGFMIACGGTGGHLFPGISVAQELRRRGHRALLLVSEKKIDEIALAAHPELERRKMAMIAMPKPLSLAMLKFLGKFWRTYRGCARVIREFRPKAVLGMGGFTSMPPIMAGRRAGLPTFIHESNAIPGKANRRTAKHCQAVLLGMEDCARHFPNKTCHVVGTPVRESFHRPVDLESARRAFGFEAGKLTLLVMGGSQGARGLNFAVCEMAPRLDPERFQILHLTGPEDFDEVRGRYRGVPVKHHLAPFCGEMELAFSLADMAVSRSGASSLTELAFFGVPSILIPYPFAAEDHQTRNAEAYSTRGAAILAPQKDLTGDSLAKLLLEKLGPEDKRLAMRERMKGLATRDAAAKICDIMEGAVA